MKKFEITEKISAKSECIERENVCENIIFYQLERPKYCMRSQGFPCCTNVEIKVLKSKTADLYLLVI